MNKRALKCERQIELPVTYEEVKMDIGFRADLCIDKKVLIELKSVEKVCLFIKNNS